jgi:hypothetical protein
VDGVDAGGKRKRQEMSPLPPSDFKNYNRNALALKLD